MVGANIRQVLCERGAGVGVGLCDCTKVDYALKISRLLQFLFVYIVPLSMAGY